MGWRFRKSFKILPGFRINVGKQGISSASIGKRGFSASIGKLGIFKNIGIPGTGLSHRSKIGEPISMPGASIGLGVAGAIIGGVIALALALFVFLSGIGRDPAPPEQVAPVSLSTNTTPVATSKPTIKPTGLPMRKKSKRLNNSR